MIKKSLGLALAIGIGAAIKIGWPDIKRYVKMRQVSAQRLHPEMVPAEGRTAYPQRHEEGAPDGTGDFDSAQRGGPLAPQSAQRGGPLAPQPAQRGGPEPRLTREPHGPRSPGPCPGEALRIADA